MVSSNHAFLFFFFSWSLVATNIQFNQYHKIRERDQIRIKPNCMKTAILYQLRVVKGMRRVNL